MEPENYHPKDIVKYRHLSPSGNRALMSASIGRNFFTMYDCSTEKIMEESSCQTFQYVVFHNI